MKKFEIIGTADTNTGWRDQIPNPIDFGPVAGFLRGFNIEIEKDGEIDYISAQYIHGTIEEKFQRELDHYGCIICMDILETKGWKMTGRAIFRGYYTEEYDIEERDWFLHPASKEVERMMSK